MVRLSMVAADYQSDYERHCLSFPKNRPSFTVYVLGRLYIREAHNTLPTILFVTLYLRERL